jgi:Rps23 Pro-64 3,4-dihydroxylase Tpa1-like proline 4-hydroxylase
MTPKQILDSFSETLMQDERILSAQERALLANLLHHANSTTTEQPETQEAVRAVIASAVGETVAQRAFSVLGGSIVERILAGNSSEQTEIPDTYAGKKSPGKTPLRTPITPGTPGQPQTPGSPLKTPLVPGSPQPQTPGVVLPPSQPQTPGAPAPTRPPHHKQPAPKHEPMRDTPVPPPKQPQTPGASLRPFDQPNTVRVAQEASTVVAERATALPARCVVLDEFLAPQELDELTQFALEHQADFSASEVISPEVGGGIVNYEHRRSRVLIDLAQHQDMMLNRIKAVLPQVLQDLGMDEFDITGVEAQITASNDGDFFRFHSDNGCDRAASRHLTFVYFFHREPRQFEGGELHIHDARLQGEAYVSEGSYQTIMPRQNQIVFFPCELLHEITPVKCASQLFADSRFTLNGWLRR